MRYHTTWKQSLAVRSHSCWQQHRGHGQTLQSEECTASQNIGKRRGTEEWRDWIRNSNVFRWIGQFLYSIWFNRLYKQTLSKSVGNDDYFDIRQMCRFFSNLLFVGAGSYYSSGLFCYICGIDFTCATGLTILGSWGFHRCQCQRSFEVLENAGARPQCMLYIPQVWYILRSFNSTIACPPYW